MNAKNCFSLAACVLPMTMPVSAEVLKLEEIVVTAQKREEGIQSVAASISAISGDTMEARGFNDPRDLSNFVPNVVAGSLQGHTTISIRGVGTNVQAASPAVAVHINGVYQPRASMADLAQVDLERVEVLRGPQGTLYGRNANGGAVNFISKTPGDELSGSIKAQYGNFDEYRVIGTLDLPLSDNVRTRLVASRWERQEGFLENVVPGEDDIDKGSNDVYRLTVEADLSDSLSATFVASSGSSEGPLNYFQGETAAPGSPFSFVGSLLMPQESDKIAANDPTDTDRDIKLYSATFNWDLSETFSLTSITAYQDFYDFFQADFDTTQLSLSPAEYIWRDSQTFTQELNLNFDTGSLSGVVGAFYMEDENEGANRIGFPLGFGPFAPGGGNFSSFSDYTTDVFALFGDVTFELSDNLRMFAGIRWSRDEQEYTQFNQRQGFLGFDMTTCDETNDINTESVTPRVGVQYDVSDNSNIYASYSKGVKIGGVSLRTGCNNNFEDEDIDAYEIGFKNTFLDDRLKLNMAAYYYDYTDLQVEQLVGIDFFMENAPESEVLGLELETVYLATANIELSANMSYQKAEFEEFSNVDSLNPGAGLQDLSGNPLPNAPKVTAQVGISYEPDLSVFDGGISFRADASYRSRRQYREFDVNADSQEAYTLVDGSVKWTSSSEQYSVRLFGRNLTDEAYIQSLATSVGSGARFWVYGAPMQYGLEVTADF